MTKDNNNSGDNLSGEDKRLWDFITRDIKPLDKPEGISKLTPPALRKPVPKESAEGENSPRITAWRFPGFGLKPPQEPLVPAGGGIDRRTSDRLKRGELRIEARLDLHGLRQSEAQNQLMQFLMQSYDADRRCVLVITGKGNRFQKQDSETEREAGVLRRLLPVWIGMAPLAQMVLMHSKAQPKDGGAGAFYILLRRRR